MNQILIFCPCAPYSSAESLVTLKLAKALLKWGYDIRILYHKNKDIPISQDGLEIMQYCIGIYAGHGYCGCLVWCIKAFWMALWMNWKYDLVISRAMPSYAHIPALILKCIKHVKWLANWSDPYPAIVAPSPYGKGINAKIPKMQSWYSKIIIKKANWLTFPSERLRNWLIHFFPSLKDKSSVIPHIMLDDNKSFVNHTYDNSRLRLIYTGGLKKRNPEIVFKAINILREKHKDLPILLTFVGDKNLEIEHLITEYGLDKYIHNLGWTNYSETCSLVEQSDVAIVLEAPCEEGIFLSSKLLDYLQCNTPVWAISPSPGVMKDLLAEYGGGVFSDCKSVDDIAGQMEYLISLWKQNKIDTVLNCSKLKDHFKLDVVKSAWKTAEMNCVQK